MPVPKPSPARLKAVRARLPLGYLRSSARSLLSAGHSAEEVARNIAGLVDRLLDFERLLPPPFGLVAEAADGPLAYAIALPLVKAARRALVKAGLLAG
jgi:hypothetical protein